MQDKVLSPASRRRTDLFDWSSSASDIPQEIVKGIPASQENFVRSLGAARRRIKHDEEVPDKVYGDTSTEETSPTHHDDRPRCSSGTGESISHWLGKEQNLDTYDGLDQC
jgi:hypothetical protein